MRKLKTEVLIVGSGFGAAAPALRFSENGFKVLMIEKGKNIDPEKDFRMTQDPKYLLKYLKGVGSKNIGFTFTEALGGGSGFYEMVSLRGPSKVFSLRSEDGRNYWPAGINRTTFDPYYDIAEKMLHVEQIAKDEIPKSGVVFSNLMKNLGYSCDRARYAVKGCVGSGFCVSGCIFGAKQSLHRNYLPMAEKSGTQILTETEALEIRSLLSDVNSTKKHTTIYGLPYRYEVKCRDKEHNEIFKIETKILILGGGTVGTAKLLLHSKKNLHFLSKHVGKNIAFNGSVKTIGLLPEGMIQGDLFSGRSHPGMISYQFFDSLGITISSAKPLPITIFSAARLILESEKRKPAYWGKAHVELVKKFRKRMIVLYALGLSPPGAEIKLTNSGTVKSSLIIDSVYKNYYKNTSNLLKSIFKRNGCKIVEHTMLDQEGQPKEEIYFSTTHMIGSCRMADKKENGVTDAFGEVFDYPGIFITDGAAVPTSLAVNSSLTILANAERIAHHLVDRYSVNRRERMNVFQMISSNNNY
jgi:choline dehydrogenase-like flavoprotein